MKISNIKFVLLFAAFSLYATAFSQLNNDFGNVEITEPSLDEDEPDGPIDVDPNALFTTPAIPASNIYSLWNNAYVNPYDTSLVDMQDTLAIDLSGYCHPILNAVTSGFGFRKYRFHYGTDIRLKVGDTVHCAFDGMIRIAGRGKAYGNYVVVRHYNGLETTYAHLSKVSVKENTLIKAGDLIGLGGNTGRSTGPHLHFEMRYLGQPINPQLVVDFETGTARNDTLQLCAEQFEYLKEVQRIKVWVVQNGDTLSKISVRTGIPVKTLCSLNKIQPSTTLRLGQKIRYT